MLHGFAEHAGTLDVAAATNPIEPQAPEDQVAGEVAAIV